MHADRADDIDELVRRARVGDHHAFEKAVSPYRSELHRHCYRMTGSLDDADDVLQEVLFRAWRSLGTFAGRSSFRTWLFRIATNRTLDVLGAAVRRREVVTWDGIDEGLEPPWLQPYPDPATMTEQRESISVAFVVAIQRLPARQRAVLLLRDVLGFSVAEVAQLLETTPTAVNSALQRARGSVSSDAALVDQRPPLAEQIDLRDQLVAAWEAADIAGLTSLLTSETRLTMPPLPDLFVGPRPIVDIVQRVLAPHGRLDLMRLLPIQANGAPGYGVYGLDESSGRYERRVVMTLAIDLSGITNIHAFSIHTRIFDRFDLPLHA